MTVDTPLEVVLADLRGKAWVYMCWKRGPSGKKKLAYQIHEDPNHTPPEGWALYAKPVRAMFPYLSEEALRRQEEYGEQLAQRLLAELGVEDPTRKK